MARSDKPHSVKQPHAREIATREAHYVGQRAAVEADYSRRLATLDAEHTKND